MAKEIERNFKVLREIISPENVQVMAELLALSETKHLIGYMGSLAEQIHNRLCYDVFRKGEVNYTISDSYDLVQTVAVFLCEHFGERLNDLLYTSKNGKRITIQTYCCRLIERQICTKARRRKTDFSLENLYERLQPRAELREEQDYSKFDELLSQMNLTENNEIILNCRMAGMSYSEIGRIVGRAISTVWHSIEVIRKRYLEIMQ